MRTDWGPTILGVAMIVSITVIVCFSIIHC